MISKVTYNGDVYIGAEPYNFNGTSGITYYVPIDYLDAFRELNEGMTIKGINYNVKRVTQDEFLSTSVALDSEAANVLNVFDGQVCDVQFTKKLHNNWSTNRNYFNFISFPFEATVKEYKNSIEGHTVELIRIKNNLVFTDFTINNNGQINNMYFNFKNGGEFMSDDEIIKAGDMVILLVDPDSETHTLTNYTFIFKNKKIDIQTLKEFKVGINGPILETANKWYAVSNIPKTPLNASNKSTASQMVTITSSGLGKSNSTATVGACGGWLEYRGIIPFEYHSAPTN